MTLSLEKYRLEWSIGLLVFVHVVGLFGLLSTSQDWFLMFTPANLLLSAGLLLLNHREWNPAFGLVLLSCLLLGFFIEVLGVHTGEVFGNYSYGEVLGTKVLGVPLLIAVNWLVLVYSTGIIVHPLRISVVLKAALSALLMTVLDMLIEPVAVALGYWDWEGGTPPLLNYLAWFGVAFLLLTLFHALRFNKQNKVALALFIVQAVFFAALNLFL